MTDAKVAKGKATFYPGKVQNPVTCGLTVDCRAELFFVEKAVTVLLGGDPASASGLKCSRSDLLEHAWRKLRGLPVNPELDAHLTKVPSPVEV